MERLMRWADVEADVGSTVNYLDEEGVLCDAVVVRKGIYLDKDPDPSEHIPTSDLWICRSSSGDGEFIYLYCKRTVNGTIRFLLSTFHEVVPENTPVQIILSEYVKNNIWLGVDPVGLRVCHLKSSGDSKQLVFEKYDPDPPPTHKERVEEANLLKRKRIKRESKKTATQQAKKILGMAATLKTMIPSQNQSIRTNVCKLLAEIEELHSTLCISSK